DGTTALWSCRRPGSGPDTPDRALDARERGIDHLTLGRRRGEPLRDRQERIGALPHRALLGGARAAGEQAVDLGRLVRAAEATLAIRAGASHTRISIVPSFGCGRRSHQM